MRISPNSPMIIWRLTDGKPGHESQTAGLVKALQKRLNCKVIDIEVKGLIQSLISLISSHWPQGKGLPLPHLIIGAGHRTHLHMLAAKRAYGGQTVVMMQPSLPVHFFDLCILPEHDQYQGNGNVLKTQGVLNTFDADGEHHDDKALIMIGGPSKHFNWDEQALLEQISQLTQQNPEIDFTLTTSRRTPTAFTTAVKRIKRSNLIVIPVEETTTGWVAQQLADSAYAWITEDSVSMVYEALTTQVAVGLLNMPMRKANRISQGVSQLLSQNILCRFDSLGHYKNTLHPALGFMEAERCADLLLNNWLVPDQPLNTIEAAQTDKAMKVVQVLPALASGGVERGTLEVAKYLVEQGHQSFVISAGGRLVTELVNAGSQHIEWNLGSKSLLTFRHIWKLRRWLEDNQIDILHVRSRMPAWICYLAWKGMNPVTRPKLITTVHGPYSVSPYSAVMTKGEKVIVISEMIRDYVLRNYHTDPQRLVLNYRGIDPSQYNPTYAPTQQWQDRWFQQYPETIGKKLLCLPARITRWKGQTDFIELISILHQQHQDIHGLIVGETKKGKDRFLQELHDLAEQKGVSAHITFTGHRSDLKEILAISELAFSFSTTAEAFGRTTIEALSLGTPVIGYAHGGVAEQLAVMLPAGQVEPGNVPQAAALADEWLKSAPYINEQHPFKLNTMLENTLKIYQQCLQPYSEKHIPL